MSVWGFYCSFYFKELKEPKGFLLVAEFKVRVAFSGGGLVTEVQNDL